MSSLLYDLCARLFPILARVGVGTNLGLLQILFALVSGRFLVSRGALVPALADCGLTDEAVRRSVQALSYGRWNLPALIEAWQKCVRGERRWHPHRYGGFRPVAVDLVGFFRAKLQGQIGKHYTARASKALPALVFGMAASVGCVGKPYGPYGKRLPLLRRLVRQKTDETESALQARVLREVIGTLAPDEITVVDAGFGIVELLKHPHAAFVARLDQNVTARRNYLPAAKGKGRPAEYGETVRPLARTYKGKTLPATRPDKVVRWKAGRHTLRAHVFENLVLSGARPGAATFQIVVIFDPRYARPLIVATNRPLSAYDLWCLYRDRWPVEQMPLAAKQMLGGERAFVFGDESRWRLPELAMLAGNVVAYVAACRPAIATGFWDRCAQPTCGRIRRSLSRVRFSDLPLTVGRFRKKASPTAHLPKGVRAHRRTKATKEPTTERLVA
jgi:hypothetical protein